MSALYDSCTCLGNKAQIFDQGLPGEGNRRPIAFSEAVSEELDLLQATQDGLMDPELQVRLLAEIEEGVHHFILISPPCSTFSRARLTARGRQPFGVKSTLGALHG